MSKSSFVIGQFSQLIQASASLDVQLLAGLEARLIDIRARIAVQSETLDPDAPSLVALKRQADALRQQIEVLSD